MNSFAFTYPTRVSFGIDATDKYLVSELKKYGKNVLLAYGRDSIKRTWIIPCSFLHGKTCQCSKTPKFI